MDATWLLILGVLVTSLSGWFFVGAVRSIRLGLESRRWPTVPGVVTVSETKQSDESWRFRIEYRFEVDGRSRRGNRLELTSYTYTRDNARALQDRYRVGTQVEVHYDPTNPAKSVLVPGAGASWVVGVFTLVVAGFGIWLMVNAIGRLVEPSSPKPVPTPVAIVNGPAGIAVTSDKTDISSRVAARLQPW